MPSCLVSCSLVNSWISSSHTYSHLVPTKLILAILKTSDCVCFLLISAISQSAPWIGGLSYQMLNGCSSLPYPSSSVKSPPPWHYCMAIKGRRTHLPQRRAAVEPTTSFLERNLAYKMAIKKANTVHLTLTLSSFSNWETEAKKGRHPR